MTSPRIMTHLFADGGRIVKSTRTDYSEHLERPDLAVVVKNMMKDQHKAMFIALRSGELDALIGFESEPPPSVLVSPERLQVAATVTEVTRPHAAPARVKPAAAAAAPMAPPEVQEPVVEKAYAVSRPASIFSVPPAKATSIFGEVAIDEKSLDDAILSYLAEDEEEDQQKR